MLKTATSSRRRARSSKMLFSSFETLESRRLLSVEVWNGSAGDHSLNDGANWDSGVAPVNGDDLQFNDLSTAQSVNFDGGTTLQVGNIFISGNYTFSGNSIELLGELDTGTNSSGTFSNAITADANNHFAPDSGGTITLNGQLSGNSQTLDKYGTGTLVLNGTSDAHWQILNGTVNLTTTTTDSFDVYAGTLTGNGTADGINVAGGTLSPTSSGAPATINSLNGFATVSANSPDSSTLSVALGSSSNSSKVVTNGLVNLNGGIISLTTASGFASSTGTVYTIISNNSGSAVTGTFDSLAEGDTINAGGRTFRISYAGGNSGHDVTLTDVGASASAPTTSLNVSATQVAPATPVTLTATISGSHGTPTGTVSFFDGSTLLGSAVTLSNGVASLANQTFAAGTHNITFTYSGNSDYSSATSAATTITSTATVTTTGPTLTSGPLATLDTAKAAFLSATATDTTTALANSLTYTWSIIKMPSGAKTPVFSANGTHAASSITASFSKDGTYHFRVTVKDSAGNTTFNDVDYVVKQKARGLRLTPHGATVAAGKTLQFSTVALDQFSHPMRVIDTPDYVVQSGVGSIGETTGLFSAGSKKGKSTIEVTLDALVGTIATKVV